MAKSVANLEFRRGCYYYRASFSLNRKTFSLRLSLETADLRVARERVARMDRTLRQRWREVMTSTISAEEQRSIMRAAARQARDNLSVIATDFLNSQYDEPDEAIYDQQRSLRALEIVVRDLHTYGLTRDFGSREYEMHLLHGRPPLDRPSLARLREVIEGGHALAAGMRDQAVEGLRHRNIAETPVNQALAARQVAVGTLLALRQAAASAINPDAALDEMLASLEMPGEDAGEASSAPPPVQEGNGGAMIQAPPTHYAPLPAPTALSIASPSGGIGEKSIKDAATAFLAAHPRYDDGAASSVWTPKTRSQFEAAVFLAYKFFGEAAVAAIDEMMIAEFLRTLRRLPRNHHKTPTHSAMSLTEIAERGVGDRLSGVTTNRHIRFVKLVLVWAWKRIPSPPVVDWSSFIEVDRRLKRDKRQAFTAAELETLFGGAIWNGWESVVRRMSPGYHLRWDAPYWVTVLLAYSGARREEIAKLETADVEDIDGIWALRIRVTDAGRLKNISSERDIPLADEIVRLGFLDFVSQQRASGQPLLFPELDRTAGSMGDVFYKKWWRAFERAGLIPIGKDIHSMRHYVATALAAADVSEERRADLLGHTMQSETGGTYTKRTPLALLKVVVNVIPNVTAHLEPAAKSRLI